MTAYRIIDDHQELDNVGELSHVELDDYLLNGGWVIVSGSPGPFPPSARKLVAGMGIALVDSGPGGDLIISSSVSGSFDPAEHETLRQLVHLADEDGPRGLLFPSGFVRDTGPWPFPTASIWWTSSARTIKYMEQQVVRNSMQLIVTSTWRLFQSDGITIADSYSDVITYSGVFETSRVRMQP